MLTKRCFSLGAIGKMLPAKCCMLEEKVSLERRFQKDALKDAPLAAVGKVLPADASLDAVGKMSSLLVQPKRCSIDASR